MGLLDESSHIGTARQRPAEADPLEATAADLAARYRGVDAPEIVAAMIRQEFPGRIALVSSFGAESAVLLDFAARVDRALPVLFLNTGKLFGETLGHRDALVARLGLTDVREILPEPGEIAAADPCGSLWSENPDRCCFLRKVAPLERALAGFDAWFTGRKRFHGAARAGLATFEAAGARIKVNPLAEWSAAHLEAHVVERGLPRHPLTAEGFLSIGCVPCTSRVAPGEDVRAGRWRGSVKTECGIHLAAGRP